MDAARLIFQRAGAVGFEPDDIIQHFSPAPTDFQVRFVKRLPLMAHLFGMVGITLLGRVWLKIETTEMSAEPFLSLLRHEAEHVRQQREQPIRFYPSYIGQWVVKFLSPRPAVVVRDRRRRGGRFYAAYRSISFEEEAYDAGDEFLGRLRRR